MRSGGVNDTVCTMLSAVRGLVWSSANISRSAFDLLVGAGISS